MGNASLCYSRLVSPAQRRARAELFPPHVIPSITTSNFSPRTTSIVLRPHKPPRRRVSACSRPAPTRQTSPC